MAEDAYSYGARLYAELRKLTGFEILTAKLNYEAIQRLKSADLEQTVKLFSGSSHEILQQLKTKDPEEAARFIAAEARRAAQEEAGFTALIMGAPFTLG